jgi:secreted trypsin-like serine protease
LRRITILLATLAAALAVVIGAAPAQAVVNGSDAVTNPGSVSLWTSEPYRNRCSGTLLDDGGAPGSKWVLTAQHCYRVFSAPLVEFVEARIGALDNTTGGDFDTRRVVGYRFHPDWDQDTLANDLLLLELDAPSFKPAVRWGTSPMTVGAVSQVNGWGWVCDGPIGLDCSSWYHGPLQRYNARVLPDTDCATVVDYAGQTCTESATGAYQSACLGDSGAGHTTKTFTGTEWVPVLRIMVLGDGDDWEGASCLKTPDGDNGLSVGIEVAHYGKWIWDTIHGDILPAPAPAVTGTQAEHELVG